MGGAALGHRASAMGAWSKSAVRAFIQNPRYTGRQVWGRQRKQEVLVDLDDVGAGHRTRQVWNDRSDWVQSAELANEPIVSAETFAQAEALRAQHGRRQAAPKVRRTPRPYMLRRLVRCGVCGRSMEGTWNNGRAHYRCRFPSEYAAQKGIDHPRTVYLREDRIVPVLDDWLATSFEPGNLDATVAAILAADDTDPTVDARAEAARKQLTDADARLSKHRAALEAGADPAIVAEWIAEVRGKREAAERVLATTAPAEPLDEASLRAMLDGLGDLRQVLGDADPTQKAEAYAGLGLQVAYHPGRKVCSASVTLADPCSTVRVGGAIHTLTPRLLGAGAYAVTAA